MDSLLVSYYIVDKDEMIHPISYPRQAPLLAGNILRDTIEFSSLDASIVFTCSVPTSAMKSFMRLLMSAGSLSDTNLVGMPKKLL
jgi:hypothetical protein